MKDVTMLSKSDLEQVQAHGLSEELVLGQIEAFRKGFPFMQLVRPCTQGDGIERIGEEKAAVYRSRCRAEAAKGRASIFVPASGAASRMFKALESVYKRDRGEPQKTVSGLKEAAVVEFVRNLDSFACARALREKMAEDGLDADLLVREGKYVVLLERLLTEKGLGYASLPKGLILFHREKGKIKTPFEEHLIEASRYLRDSTGTVRIHFTVPEEFEPRVRAHIGELRKTYEKDGLRFDISFSCQKPSTDTVAVDLDNRLFRDSSSRLVFRPAGHGALLDNLADLKGDIVFIKNIDNVLPDRGKEATVKVQELLGGYLADRQTLIHSMLGTLSTSSAENVVREAVDFIRTQLGIEPPAKPFAELRSWAMDVLNRPIRVCGMVMNEGEPGGGPFWVASADGSVSKQIVEKSQVDSDDSSQTAILGSATHFNPVDLVCGLRDFRGRPFDLKKFVDPQTGFISVKSKEGRDLKALELPGLWNGAMAFWLTFFVEIPVETFGPVKEFNDLLREKHRPEE